ncbi:MAG: hypothetical protein R3E79_60350 [Caldilineaceae bacterium]
MVTILTRSTNLTERLQQASHALTQQMYQQAGGQSQSAGEPGRTPGSTPGSEDDVVEGNIARSNPSVESGRESVLSAQC